jgi:preprotein translocase subunit SecD
MQVQANDAIKTLTTKNLELAQARLQEKGWPVTEIKATGYDELKITVPDMARNSDIIGELQNEFNNLMPEGRGWSAQEVGTTITFKLGQEEQNELRERATQQAMQIIQNRIDAFGVAEPNIQRHGGTGSYQILLQMPGIDNPERVKNTLKADSNLEIRSVPKNAQAQHPTREAAENAAKALPGGAENYDVLFYRERATAEGGANQEGWVILEKKPVVTGFDVRDATAGQATYASDNYQINFSLTTGGAKRFGDWTGQHIGDQMAIVLNNEVKSIATIQDQIFDKGQITGSFTKTAADDLSLVLRSGALPAKVTYLEERTVGPSLGADSIR